MDLFEEFGEELVCKICNQTEGLEKDQIHETNDVQAHLLCLLFSSGLGQKGKEEEGIKGFLAADIRKELKRGARLKCVYCRKKGATVGCAEQKCKKSYHLPCGNQHDSLQQYFDQFRSYCKDHRPPQKVPRTGGKKSDKKDNICTICQEKLARKITLKTLWAPCCEEFFHRSCIQGLAHSCGSYNFRCPLCNDKDKFTLEMKIHGIYIPVQDASWENSQGYQDIDEPPVQLCHAKICFCPQEGGRAYNKEHGLWEVLPCRSCGSRGIHAKCGGLEDFPDAVWDCYNCKKVMKDDKPKLNPHTEKLWSYLHEEQNRLSDEPKSTSETRSNPNRLFEALLATLPHLQSLEENLSKEDTGSDKLQLTITPVTSSKESRPDIFASSSSDLSSTLATMIQPVSSSLTPAVPLHSQSNLPSSGPLVSTSMSTHEISLSTVSMQQRIGANSSTGQPRFPTGSTISTPHLSFTSAVGSHSSPYLSSANKSVPGVPRTSLAPVELPHTATTLPQSTDAGPSGLNLAQRTAPGGHREKIAVKVENGGRKLVTKRIPNLGKPVKELYDYSLEDIIRSRLKENNGDEHDGVSLKLQKSSCGNSLKEKSGLGQFGIQKNPAVLRLVTGDPSPQRKMTEYFMNRKH